jgi:hypothetical protein
MKGENKKDRSGALRHRDFIDGPPKTGSPQVIRHRPQTKQ